MSSTTLLFADTLAPNTVPHSVHEIRFRQPVYLHAFRIVCDGERPHVETSFVGQTAPAQLTIELFGCEHGRGVSTCVDLLAAPHQRQRLACPSAMNKVAGASARVDYVVIRSACP